MDLDGSLAIPILSVLSVLMCKDIYPEELREAENPSLDEP